MGTTLEFSQSSRTQQVPVTIFEDNLTEDNETFVADLFDPLVLVGGVQRVLAVSEADRIRIQPDTAIVEITDNDGEFMETTHLPINIVLFLLSTRMPLQLFNCCSA